jgi:hypothetical protein
MLDIEGCIKLNTSAILVMFGKLDSAAHYGLW